MRTLDDQSTSPESRVEAWLLRAGLRPTRQRKALAELLIGDGEHRHVTAESLYEAASAAGAGVSLATVYNTLRVFTDAGLLREIGVEGPRSYFDTRTEDHPHFFYEDEGLMSDAPTDSIEISRLPAPPDGSEITGVDIVVRLRRKE